MHNRSLLRNLLSTVIFPEKLFHHRFFQNFIYCFLFSIISSVFLNFYLFQPNLEMLIIAPFIFISWKSNNESDHAVICGLDFEVDELVSVLHSSLK